MKNVLSIAGVDPSGGAGLIADLKVFIAHGVYAMGVVTATTAQNTKGLFGMELIEPKMISDGIDAIFDDIKVDAVKIGVVPSVEIIKATAASLKKVPNLPPVVLDPVMSCKNGDIWLEGESKKAIVEELFPLATVITPNKFEAQEILGKKLESKTDFENACKELLKFGCKNVYLKAGKVDGKSLDVFYNGTEFTYIENERIDTDSTHGSGCSLSSAIASNLANQMSAKDAALAANEYIFNAIKSAHKIGHGCNPVNHFYKFY
ncbi:bifunctional hydroxymethylpyrimidine kinase/phosphomethylpyrimidine kinase [Campylobacter geochelonis]|uniref:hydroxymethylpyrimidine kinase n=1 Tax=Campylobacter geochelonis TaxID=1780362 RepID=A0A128EKJ0_9BACT|nr:bifunctional hydroxymethylpyrimidine kinase/phosphomethylpyrimidine kinase [Campylobacter geochelonis]QKF71595.1 hydroxymethylpyrimidine kinase / phosphohydroxymethylpyrimidine kinase [Campylobacter geochelonis]CZE48656.1 phosphomethylpyrimidine kinase [Campylobacter geochelonis]CZE48743.1 phosphomethylpyrimidine kinase [Campylobacter geochelonis]